MLPDNNNIKHTNELPKGMFGKMLAASLVSVIGACLLALAIFSA